MVSWLNCVKEIEDSADRSLIAVGNQSMCCIIRGNADLDTVSNHYLDPMFLHAAGQHTPHNDIIFTLDLHTATAQNSGDVTI